MRAFFAIELDEPTRDAIARFVQTESQRLREARWCTAAQLHVTLKFLGEVDDRAVPELVAIGRAAAAALAPFDLRVSGLGGFPTPRRPRVLWMGVEDATASARRWLADVEPGLAARGFPAETRPFQPHLTLARSRDPAGSTALGAWLARREAPPARTVAVTHFTLFQSVLKPSGAEYRVLAETPLGIDSPA
ncbi:MAG: RNA 2',3'-cyclic phosphodiesterase [Phycisphaerae bacterium]